MSKPEAGQKLRAALDQERPLQIVGTVTAYCAMLAARAGFRAIYLSGAGVANSAFGLPDLAVTTLNDVAEEVRRITGACDLPLLVDADTGFGGRPSTSPGPAATWRARAPRDCTWRTRCPSSAAGTVPASTWCPRRRCATG